MEAVAEGLWGLADLHESEGEFGKAVKCLEAVCQSQTPFLPIIEVKTRLRVATMLLKHSNNVNQAKGHLERAQVLLNKMPSCFELKCRAYSLLSQCYHLVGAIPSQKHILSKALELTGMSGDGFTGRLWFCNFNSQRANALIIEGDYQESVTALEHGYICATKMCYQELQMFFAASILHVHLIQWVDINLVEGAVNRCQNIWDSFTSEKAQQCPGLFFYHKLLHIFYILRVCDYKSASEHVDKLDAAMKFDSQRTQHIQKLNNEIDEINQTLAQPNLSYRDKSSLSEKSEHLKGQLSNIIGIGSNSKESLEPAYFGNIKRSMEGKLELAPPPMDGEWLPKGAIYALVDLIIVVFNRPKGLFRECARRIQSGMKTVREELINLGIDDEEQEGNLQPSAIWMAGVYLMLLMQFLENKVVMDLTRSEFVEAQQSLVQMRNWYIRFPTILQACQSTIEMLRGQYAHSVGCYSEAAYHFLEASTMTVSKPTSTMCQVYAAASYICMGDAESSSNALNLVGPLYRFMDSFVGVREKTSTLFVYGLLLMRQDNLQEARTRLASGLQTTHSYIGSLQLISQYLTALGGLALALHDVGQAREILRSSLTLAKKLYDVPTQIWSLSNLTSLYQQLGEKANEIENVEYQQKKIEDLHRRVSDARRSPHHFELIEKVKLDVSQPTELDMNMKKRASAGSSMRVDLDIPESVGLSSPSPMPASSRLMDLDLGRIRSSSRRRS